MLGSDFDISDHDGISAAYAELAPFVWPANPRKRGGRFFADSRVHTLDGRARMLAIAPPAPQKAYPDHPFRLNTGCIRDQWHTKTRTARSPHLSQHLAEPYLELHLQDAARLGLSPAELVQVETPLGRAILQMLIFDPGPPEQPFVPMHWTAEAASTGRIDTLVPEVTDIVSGQPDSKVAVVSLPRNTAIWHGFAVSAQDFTPQSSYWAKARVTGGRRVELAGTAPVREWVALARQLSALPDAPVASVIDHARGLARLAFHHKGKLLAALFIWPRPLPLSRSHIAGQLGQTAPEQTLTGRAPADLPDPGPTVCACMNVGLNTIRDAICSDRAMTAAALGTALGAGTSCGSCRPELSALISRNLMPEAAE